ncbi:MAG: ABC transporter substrate-binding protein [Phycisphaerales bacterium JB043]
MSTSRVLVVLSLLVILGLPWLYRPKSASHPDNAERLVVITPNVEHLRIEFARGFSEWHEATYGTPVFVDFRQPGGTSEIRRQLMAQYESAIRRGDIAPDGSCEVGTMPYDLLFSGGSYEHDQMRSGVTVPIDGRDVSISISVPASFSQEQLDAWFGENVIGSTYLYDPERYWISAALSSFGMLYNRDLLDELGVEEPTTWTDLADPKLTGWLGLADPRMSGSVSTTFESILNNLGWELGWRTLRAMCANAQYFASSSSKTPLDVSAGESAVGLAIDFYGRYQEQAVREFEGDGTRARLGYVDPAGQVYIDPDQISILRGGPHPEMAHRFIEYVLSDHGQAVWQLPAKGEEASWDVLGPRRFELRKLPTRRSMYTDYFDRFIDKVKPFEIASDAEPSGWRSMIAPMMGAFAIDIHHDMIVAWEAMHHARLGGVDDGLLDEMDDLFFAMPEHVFLDDDMRPTGQELPFTEENYHAIRNDWRNPRKAAEHKIAYTAFFRSNYKTIVERLESEALASH